MHTDQQSLDTISALGCRHVQTPHLDRMAERGVSFRQSYSADPLCMPARTAWYTGRPSSETGVVKNNLPLLETVPDLGAWLRRAGYETVYSGKWHVPGRDVERSFRVLVGKTIYGEVSDRVVSHAAAAFLRSYDGEKPFFLSVGFLQPHDINYWLDLCERGGPPRLEPGDVELPALPPNARTDLEEPTVYRERRTNKVARLMAGWSEENWRTYLWSYYRMVEMVDAEIGRVLDALQASRHGENTLVVFSSDHGESLGQHGFVSKSNLYEAAVRVPFLVAWPGRVRNGVRDEHSLVSGLDLFPTLLDYAGVEPPPLVRGRSLRPLLEGDDVTWRASLVSECDIEGRMVRSERYKLIRYEGDPVELFFDLAQDPWEMRSLTGDSALAPELEHHRRILGEWEAGLVRAPEPPGGWREER